MLFVGGLNCGYGLHKQPLPASLVDPPLSIFGRIVISLMLPKETREYNMVKRARPPNGGRGVKLKPCNHLKRMSDQSDGLRRTPYHQRSRHDRMGCERPAVRQDKGFDMLNSIEGVFRDGRVELLEPVPPNAGDRVIVTFLSPTAVDLRQRGIDEEQAADLRRRLTTFAEDWDRPEMDVYDAL